MIAGILLAAGRSQRMGQPKLLLPWHGVPLVRHAAQTALASDLDELLVVVGHRAEDVKAAVMDLPVRIVHNDAFWEGQSTSIRAGILALRQEAEAVVVLLADHPLLQPATVDALLANYAAAAAPIVVPRYAGRRGNPVLLARSLFPALLALRGDQGARPLLQNYAEQITWLDVADEGILLDVDTPEMFQSLIERNVSRASKSEGGMPA